MALAVVNPHGKIRDPRWIEPAAVTLSAEKLDTGTKAPLADAAKHFLATRGGEWEFVVEPRTDRALLIQGSGIPWLPGRGNQLRTGPTELTIEALDPMARQLIEDHAALLQPSVGELELDLKTSSIRQRGRLISIYYRWKIDGVPVEHARVFVRSNHGNVTQMGAPYVGLAVVETKPAIDSAQAIQAALQYSGDDELYRIVEQPELWIQPEALGAKLGYRLIWKFVYQLPQSVARWEVRVDALSSAIVGFRDITNYGRAWGGVYERGVGDGVEVLVPFPAVSVSSNGSPFITDSAGFFPFTGGSVASGLNGPIFNTNCQGCSNPSQPNVSTSVGSGRIDFGLGGSDQLGNGLSTPADRNAGYHLTQVRRLGQKWLPALGWLNSTITTNVNIANTCNATYGGNTVNFYRSGGGCNNTGEVSDVMHHEWGHGLDLNTRSGDGATGEATADVVAIHMSHSPLIGPYFRTDGSPVRNLDQFTSGRGFLSIANLNSKCPIAGSLGPLGYEVHCEGEIYGQVAWDLAVALTAKHGEHTGWRESERIFFNALPDSGGYLPGSSLPVYDAYINADDDDGNLANGTPNGDEIFAAFDAHGMANSNPGSSAACARPAQPTLIVTPSCDQFDLSWGAVPGVDHYEIFRAELRIDSTFFPVAEVTAGTTNYSDLEVSPALDYHYVVMAVDASDCESTVESPIFARLTAQPILGVTAAIDDDIPQGNRSGSADPGETVDLLVDLSNFGDSDGTSINGSIISTTPGVTLLASSSAWPAIPSGGAATNLDTLRFSTDDSVVSCGDRLAFEFVPTEASGCASQSSYFEVPLGVPATPIVDSFEFDSGWVADAGNSTTPAGAWVRGTPELTTYQPGNDASANGTDCWFTASNPTGDAEVDDVDRGQVVLLSPVYDLSGYGGATLRYSRWWSHSDPGADPGDFFRTEVSDDGGLSWRLVEKLDNNTVIASWTPVSFDLSALVEMTNQVQIRFIAADGMAVTSIVEAAVDDLSIDASLCDSTPACFDEPTFAGLQLAAQGESCAETTLNWASASSNCQNASIYYNVYRSTTPGFTPDASTLLATGLTTTSLNDSLLQPGQSYHYIVRAFDSRSGEDSNMVAQTIVAPTAPDLAAPIFSGLNGLQTIEGCGGAQLGWSAALETCSLPVVYEVHRSTAPGFTPDATTLVAQTTGTSYEDLASPGVEYSYIVRAADGAGNDDGNSIRLTASAGITDRVVQLETFESSGGGWSVVAPNDAATGSWEWGDPQGTSQQPEDDATPSGVNAWITGLPASFGGGNNDIDAGTTTLLSATYDSTGLVDPAVGYARWFTNDLGASPGNDPLVVEVSNDNGLSWLPLETINTGLPLAWNKAQVALDPILTSTDQMRFRFTAQDLGAGSLVEAGIDDFAVIDQNEGCNICATPVNVVGVIAVDRVGDDVFLDWSGDPAIGDRFAIYQLVGADFTDAIRIGTTNSRTFTHSGAILSADAFNYRVTAVDSCGNESLRD
jgi:hypothetical protein